MNESHLLSPAAEPELGYGQLFVVLLRRRFWFLGVFCGVLSLAIIQTLIAKPTFQSSMQLLVQPNYQGKNAQSSRESNSDSQYADSNVETDTATQLNVMRSPLLLQRAVDLLQPEYPTMDVDQLQKSLILTQLSEKTASGDVDTKILQAEYTGNDPVKTQKVLNALLKVYQDYNLEQQKQRLSKGLGFINEQLPEVRQSVNEAEGTLEQFRKGQNLVDPTEQAAALSQSLDDIKKQRQEVQAQYQDSQDQYQTLQQQLGRSTQGGLTASRLSQSSRYQSLLNEIQKTELELSQQRLRYTDANPVIQNLEEQRQRQLALLQKETGRVLGKEQASSSPLTEGQLSETDLNLASQLAEVQKNLAGLRARDQSLAQAEQQVQAELKRFPSLIATFNRLQPEVQTRHETLQRLLQARQELGLELARGGFNWQPVEQPQLGKQIAPDPKLNLMLGAVVGLFLGGLAAFLREAADGAVHTSDELMRQVNLPLLGMVPEAPRSTAHSTTEIVQWPPFRESLNLIYKNIELLNSAFSPRSLIVTSALSGEGKSLLALGLAISAARLHKRVLLIDADLRCPSLHRQLDLPNKQGLSTLLASDAPLPTPNRSPSSSSPIDILTSGPMPTDPVKLLSSPRMGQILAAFEKTYDLVLIDSPPVLGTVDTLLAASFCSGVVMVGRVGRVTQAELMQAKAMLSRLNVIGIIANGSGGSSYGYDSRYILPMDQYQSLSFRLYQPLMPTQEPTTPTTPTN